MDFRHDGKLGAGQQDRPQVSENESAPAADGIGVANPSPTSIRTYDHLYEELQSHPHAVLPKDKGDLFEALSLHFLRNDPVWSQQLGLDRAPEKAHLWCDAPQHLKWHGRDIGTDLVVEDGLGRVWAIQAKGYREDRDVRKQDIDTFLSDSNRQGVFARIIITSSAALAPNAQSTIDGQEKPVYVLLSGHLREARLDWPESISALREAKDIRKRRPESRDPLPHQAVAIDQAVRALRSSEVSRGQVLMACGTGKTLVGQRIAEGLSARTILVLVPSLMLLRQTLSDWVADATQGHSIEWIAVCSDSTVQAGKDESIQHIRDLGIPSVTTNSDDVRTFLMKRTDETSFAKVIFATYQSSERISEALQGHDALDLIICDEAHRIAGVKVKNSVHGAFSLVLDDKKIPARKRLFMTATPRVFGSAAKQRANTENESLLASMDDSALFGSILHEYSFRDAIRDGVLADYRILGVVVAEPEIESLITSQANLHMLNKHDEVLDIQDAASAASHVAVAKAMNHDDYGISSVITFHNTIAAAATFANEHNAYRANMGIDEVWSGSIKGSESAKKRADALRKLEPGRPPAVLSNSRCLTEGIDVPSLGAVAFIEPRYSPVDIAQAIGRVLRKGGTSKELGYVIVPIFLPRHLIEAVGRGSADALDEIEQLLETDLNKVFARLVDVIRGLRSFDGMITEVLQTYRIQHGARPKRRSRRNILNNATECGQSQGRGLQVILDFRGVTGIPGQHDEEVQLAARDMMLANFVESLELLCVDEILQKCIDGWWERYGQLAEFIKEQGRYPSFGVSEGTEKRLASWINDQRTSRASMKQERVDALEELPDWTWDARESVWWATLAELKEFVCDSGRYPIWAADDESEASLARWMNTQRSRHLRSDRGLAPERSTALEALPDWSWDVYGERWLRILGSLGAFVGSHGRFPVSNSADEDEKSLALWASQQRTQRTAGRLSEERIAALESIPGWFWNHAEGKWTRSCQALADFIALHGRYPRAGSKDPEEAELGRWVNVQRGSYRERTLSESRVRSLEVVVGWSWDPLDAAWSGRFHELEDFVRREQRLPRQTNRNEKVLAHWIANQRLLYPDKIAPDKVERLEALPHWSWDPRGDQWWKTFGELQEYVLQHGSLPLRGSSDALQASLANWIHVQRGRRAELTVDRAQALESLSAWSWVGKKGPRNTQANHNQRGNC